MASVSSACDTSVASTASDAPATDDTDDGAPVPIIMDDEDAHAIAAAIVRTQLLPAAARVQFCAAPGTLLSVDALYDPDADLIVHQSDPRRGRAAVGQLAERPRRAEDVARCAHARELWYIALIAPDTPSHDRIEDPRVTRVFVALSDVRATPRVGAIYDVFPAVPPERVLLMADAVGAAVADTLRAYLAWLRSGGARSYVTHVQYLDLSRRPRQPLSAWRDDADFVEEMRALVNQASHVEMPTPEDADFVARALLDRGEDAYTPTTVACVAAQAPPAATGGSDSTDNSADDTARADVPDDADDDAVPPVRLRDRLSGQDVERSVQAVRLRRRRPLADGVVAPVHVVRFQQTHDARRDHELVLWHAAARNYDGTDVARAPFVFDEDTHVRYDLALADAFDSGAHRLVYRLARH